MKKLLLLILIPFYTLSLWGQEPPGYYNAANGKKGRALRLALAQILNTNTTSLTYSGLWSAFPQTDVKSNGKIWDIYSDIPGGTPPYEYTPVTDQCGNYSGEGSCYNREHVVPKSWFNDQTPMYTDLFHMYPTDGWVNNKRGNLPFGEVGNATWTSRNGSKIGNCITAGYSGTVFEPIDAFKGDIARLLLYMCTRYYNRDFDQSTPSMFTDGNLNPWALDMLIRWHEEDPVSQKELDRNNAVYALQHNRNPFVDYPELVGKIFGVDSVNAFNYGTSIAAADPAAVSLYPNPAQGQVAISSTLFNIQTVVFYDVMGKELLHETLSTPSFEPSLINISSLSPGIYLLKITDDNNSIVLKKLVVQ